MALEKDSTNKVLRRNYARFVEFYQAFNPPEETEEGDEGEADPEATGSASSEREAGGDTEGRERSS